MKIGYLIHFIYLIGLFFGNSLVAQTGDDLVKSDLNQGSSNIRSWIKNKTPIRLNSCRISFLEKISTVSYLRLQCQNGSRSDLIHFGEKNPLKVTDSLEIAEIRNIGKKKYIEVRFLDSFEKSQNTITPNPGRELSNLTIFLELFKNPTHKKNDWKRMEIFFNSDCPLKYIGFNHDFYWDDTTLHEFEITCLAIEGIPKIVSFQGDSLGRLPLNNVLVNELIPNNLYYARVFLDSWKGDSLVWTSPLIYSYEK